MDWLYLSNLTQLRVLRNYAAFQRVHLYPGQVIGKTGPKFELLRLPLSQSSKRYHFDMVGANLSDLLSGKIK